MDYRKQDRVVPIALGIILLAILVGGSLYLFFDSRSEISDLRLQNQDLTDQVEVLSSTLDSLVSEVSSLADLANALIIEEKYDEAVRTLSRMKSISSQVEHDASEPTSNSAVSGSITATNTQSATVDGEVDIQSDEKPIDEADQPEDESIRGFTTLRDEIEDIAFVFNTEVYLLAQSKIELYIGQSDSDSPWLRFKIYHRYTADESWLFVDSFVFKIDGVRYEVTPDFQRIRRDTDESAKWEWFDSRADEWPELINAIITGKTVLLRCEGGTRVEDRVVSPIEKNAMSMVLEHYIDLGGVW